MKRIKSGILYQYDLDCPDLERFILRRLFRRLRIPYIPFTLRFYDELYLREDFTKYNRMLIKWCKCHGIRTYVVQESDATYWKDWQDTCHLPLHADYFICPEQLKQFWVDKGMPESRIRTFRPEPKKFTGILFLTGICYYKNRIHGPQYYRNWNSYIFTAIDWCLKRDIVFKIHPGKDHPIFHDIIPPYRIVTGDTDTLITQYDDIYCFDTSSVISDCKRLGKPCTIVKGWNHAEETDKPQTT